MKNFLMFLVVCLLFSCNTEKKEEKSLFEIINGNTSLGHFRGITIRSSMDDVKANETLPLMEESGEELIYYAPFSEGEDSTYVKIHYMFDEFGLFEIQADIFPADEKGADFLFEKFKDHFDSRFGKSNGSSDYVTWKTYSSANKTVEVLLIDETPDAGKPFISINFLEPLEKEY